MRPTTCCLLAACATVTAHPAAFAAEPASPVQDEIRHLLDYLEHSGCSFYRNGQWYVAARAKEHIGQKYSYLLKKDAVRTAEDFIRWAATQSSVSGQPYWVQCPGGQPVLSATWLQAELSRYREALRARK